MKDWISLPLHAILLAIVIVFFASCSDDSIGGGGDGGDKVCAPDCDAAERCVDGVCVACPDPLCGGVCCAKKHLCDQVTGECEAPCLNESARCNGACCSEDESCKGGACVASCEDGREYCGNVCCQSDMECNEGVCAKPCVMGKCEGNDICAAGFCIKCDTVVCAGKCCEAGKVCDELYLDCADPCSNGQAPCDGKCCDSGEYCSLERLGCWRDCDDGRTACFDGEKAVCCSADTECIDSRCVLHCKGKGPRCGASGSETCCELDQLCDSVSQTCRMGCDPGTTLCAGTSCCNDATQICLGDRCLTKGKACENNGDCSWTQFCDPASRTCVELADSPNHCVYIPPVGEFSPSAQWNFPEGVLGSAIVINLTDDNGDGKIDENDIPDVVFVTAAGKLVALSGDTGEVLAQSAHIANSTTVRYGYRNDLGAAKVDGDEYPEIVVGTSVPSANPQVNFGPQYQLVMNLVPDGSGYKFVEKARLTLGEEIESVSVDLHPSFADVDGDGKIEIVTTRGILNNDMSWRCQFKVGAPKPAEDASLTPSVDIGYNIRYGANYLDDVIVADLDGDGNAEIISAGIFDNNCKMIVPRSQGGGHHYAVADLLPNNGKPGELIPEIVRVRNVRGTVGTVEVWKVYKNGNTWSSEKIKSADLPINKARAKVEQYQGTTADCDANLDSWVCNAWGGPPVIADFDGDGKMDIGLATTWYYLVYRNDLTVLWQDGNITDFSSGRTGSSVFDFEGDGIAEVVYRDELKLRIYSGPGKNDGPNILFETPSTSATVTEYPLIVDVDNDGNSEIVMVSNEGVTAYRDVDDNWIRTRRVWNQHSYHVTNINEDGSVPTPETANWLDPKLNNYRQNVQSEGMFNAPDLVADAINYSHNKCNQKLITITAAIKNEGSLAVGAGVNVAFYIEGYGPEKKTVFIGDVQTTKAISPGTSQNLSFDWDLSGQILPELAFVSVQLPQNIFFIVDGAKGGKIAEKGEHNECKEDNNRLTTSLEVKACPIN